MSQKDLHFQKPEEQLVLQTILASILDVLETMSAGISAPGLVRALGCAVQNLQQDPPAVCLVWSLDPNYGLVSTVVWPRKDFQKAITSMLKVS